MNSPLFDELPKRFDAAGSQARWYALWEERGYFHSEPDPSREPFTIVIPPPNVTGALHLGHALNNTLQDILIRQKRMQGFNVLWMPGTDHAGIATQAVVERRIREEENKTRHDLGRTALVERIWVWKDAYECRILEQLKKMGCSCDWQRTRFTLDDVCARAVRQTFFSLFRQQKLYRGKRLVNWDTFLQTAVSDDEVSHEVVQGFFWHFRYPVIDPQPGEPTFVTIATTRPETMLGDTAVAVHPDPAAALDQVLADLRQKIASASAKDRELLQTQWESVSKRRTDMLPTLELLRDMARAGRRLMLPLVNRSIPLVMDTWAKPELGTGCVKITPAHDPNDYEVGLRCGLPMINILNSDGTLNAVAGDYTGLTVAQARQRVVHDLEKLGLLEKVEDREIDLAHSDRSKTPIEPYLADQWFVRMAELAQSAMDAVSDERVQIFPSRYAKGYLDWLSEKRDWPVSRQLWWGHQIPVWSLRGRQSDDAFWQSVRLPGIPNMDIGKDSMKVQPEFQERIAACFSEVDAEGMLTLFVCVAPGQAELESHIERAGFVREEDVLDTWFSSALWPHSTLGWPEKTPELAYYYPTSTLITSRDIITLWVARMVLTGLNNLGEVPFREVFIHPKILDGYGETMSKSKGNGVDPLDVIEKFGADALRFGLAFLTTETQDVRMPVQFECPHCEKLMDQTKQNRELPRISCEACHKPFATQWARSDDDKQLPRGAVVSERFELARNFCNKLWNAARFTLMNLREYAPAPVATEDLRVEDQWILSRLATVTQGVTDSLNSYQYADAARWLYDFAWNDFCSVYVEITKRRVDDESTRPVAQRILAHVLDTLLRLLHPMIPFLTEEVWQLLVGFAPVRGLSNPQPATESIVIAPWPIAESQHQDPLLEGRFAKFLAVLAALREIRSRQNIPPKQEVRFAVRCDVETVELLRPMAAYFQQMAMARSTDWGPDAQPPATHAKVSLPNDEMEVFLDLHGCIDVDAEIVRHKKQVEQLTGLISAKESKLSNQNFVGRAPAEVVAKERESLAQMQEQLASAQAALKSLAQG